ncbi:hypothetical protein [Pedobacter sp.]|uniref:hypothetical protein n=1 Tax=Pedobacter sp. TaxID=1411316 RepID=UPI00396C8C04
MDNLRLGIEFPIDNDRLRQESAESKRIISGVGDTATDVQNRVQQNMQKSFDMSKRESSLSKDEQAMFKKRQAEKEAFYKQAAEKIIAYEQEINRLTKAGKKGFDEMGNAIPKFDKPLGLINRLAYAAELYRKAVASAINPELIAKYNRKLEETEQKINQLKNVGKKGFDEIGNAIPISKAERFKEILSGVLSALGVTFSIQQVVEFGKELFNVAQKAEGIELAFAKIGNGKDLEKLRAATKGTVSDLDLVAVAVRADKFKIPMDTLAMGLAFARQQAKDMGGDVDYMVNSFVDGLGRKSTMILDNLGISAAAVSEQIKKTGDFSKAVGNVIKEEMAKGGVEVDTLSEKTSRLAAFWDNLKTTVANTFNTGRLDMERIGNMTKAGTLDMGHYRYETRLDIIEKQSKKVRDLAAQRLDLEKKIATIGPAADEAMMKTSFERRLKDIKEQEQAQNNIYQSMQKQHQQLNEQHRISKGILSVEELRLAAEEKRARAKDLVIRTAYDAEYVKRLYREADEIDEKIAKITGKAEKKQEAAYAKSLESYRLMKQKIDEVNAKYEARSMSKNDTEVQEVRNEFIKLSEEVDAFNKKRKNMLKVDGTGLTATMNKAITDLRYRQETEALKVALEKQKQLYQDFEEYKLTFGEAKAKERFKNEINVNSSYLTTLQTAYAIASAQNVKSGGRGTTSDRLKALKTDIDAAEKSERQRYDNLLKDLLSYEQKRTILVENYQKNRTLLVEKGKTSEVTVLDQIHKEALGRLDDENTQKLDAYKKLFLGIEDLSDKAAAKVIADARSMLKKLVENGTISVELAKQISDKLKESQKSLDDRLPQRLQKLGGELKNIAGLVGDVEWGKWVAATGDVLSGLGNIKEQVNTIQKNWGEWSTMDKIGAGFGLFGSFISLGDTISSLFNRGSQAALEQARYASDLQIKQTEALTKALDRQLALIKEVYGIERITKYTEAIGNIGTATNKAKEDLSQLFALTGDKQIDDLLKKWNETLGKGWSGQDRIIFNKLWDSGQLGQYRIAVNDLTALQKLLDEGKLDEKAAALARTILDLAEKEREATNAIKEGLTGTGFEELADGIFDAIVDGANNGAKSFEEIMRKAMLNSLKSSELTAQIQKFYDDFANANKNGLDDAKIAELRAQYDAIVAKGKADAAAMEKITGISLQDQSSTTNSLSGAYRSASQESIDLLAGQTGGFRLAQLEGNELLKVSNQNMLQQLVELKAMQLTQKEIEVNTRNTAENTGEIKQDIKKLNDTIQSVYNSLRSTGRLP